MRLFLRRLPALGGLQLFALICAAVIGIASANAATLIVTTAADSGAGSLRQALADAHNGDTIQFDAALNGQTINLTSGELVIDKNITISGPGSNLLTVSRASTAANFRIFHVTPNHTVIIGGLTISGGLVDGTSNGGGILNSGSLTIANSTISGNQAGLVSTSQIGYGGGISNSGMLEISSSFINSNSANFSGGGISNTGTVTIMDSAVSNNQSGFFMDVPNGYGGGISNSGTLELSKSAITGNEGRFCGGGISNTGTVTITDGTIRDNAAGFKFSPGSGLGGGISNQDHGTVTVRNSRVSANRTTGHTSGFGGGGIGSDSSNTTQEIINSTISGNFSFVEGGGVLNGGSLTITNSTFGDNSSSSLAGAWGIHNNGGMLQIGNTILKGGQGANIINSNSGTVISHGYNLSSDNGGGFLNATGDQINTDPMLGPLQNNGGPTFTHELLVGSPAINAGDPNFTPPPFTDQRGPGYARVFNGRIDIGSFEVQPTPPPITISGTISYCSNPVPGPVPNVVLTLTGSASGTMLSDGAGNYIFSSLASGGTYTVTPSKAAVTPGGTGANINTIDVVATQRHFLLIALLSGCRLTAADVNGDNAVNTVDVVAIQRFYLGATTGTANVGQYKFTPVSRTYPALINNQTGQNYDALVLGDVVAPFVE